MIAAIYARKSTDEGAKDANAKSITRQIENAKAYAQRKDWTMAEEHVYSDDGISGAELSSGSALSDSSPRWIRSLGPSTCLSCPRSPGLAASRSRRAMS